MPRPNGSRGGSRARIDCTPILHRFLLVLTSVLCANLAPAKTEGVTKTRVRAIDVPALTVIIKTADPERWYAFLFNSACSHNRVGTEPCHAMN